jgi:elongation factor Ts
MAVSIEQIQKLRNATGVSIIACKKALVEADGDYDKAVEILRKKGQAKAADRAGRSTGEGAVFVKTAEGKTALVALRCETDFVARGDDFLELLNVVADELIAGKINSGDDEVQTVKDAVLRLGENVQVGGLYLSNSSVAGTYVHSNKKIGVLVELEGGSEDMAKDIAMHAAATNPAVLTPDEVSDELVEKEKGIWIDQLKQEGKPEQIIEKIMMGKEKKFREESALVKQAFVKNPDQTIEELLASGSAKITNFVRFSV